MSVRPDAPPNWVRELLYTAAEKLALAEVTRCEFQGGCGDVLPQAFIASLRFDLVTTVVTVYVHHKASGCFVCRSHAVNVDEIDDDSWCADFKQLGSPAAPSGE